MINNTHVLYLEIIVIPNSHSNLYIINNNCDFSSTILLYLYTKFSRLQHKMLTEDLSTKPQLGTPSVIIFEYLSQSREVDVDDSRNTSDVIIYCSNGVLMAHQLILASISPVLCSEFVRNKFDEVVSIFMPDLSTETLSKYLDGVYRCKDLDQFSDINNMLGFKFASLKKHVSQSSKNNNYKETYSIDSCSDREENFDAAELVDTDLKEEVDADEEDFVANNDNSPIYADDNDYKVEVKSESSNTILGSLGSERKKRSKIWDKFTMDSKDSMQCLCNNCNEVVMIRNMKCRIQVLENHYKYCKKGIPQPSSGTRPKRSKVWKYYIVSPTNPALCVCQICQETVSYKNQGTSAMIKHLQVSHTIILETIARKSAPRKKKYPDGIKPKKEPVLDPETGLIKKNVPTEVRKKRRKEVWQHFESFPGDGCKAKCKICQQFIEMKAHSVTIDLVKHLNTHNIKLELETCSVCGKTFDERVKRRHHEKMHHVVRTHPCSHCGKLFRDNSAKERHERTHTGEKPFAVRIHLSLCVKSYIILISVHPL